MATVRCTIVLNIDADDAWATIADVGAVNQILPFLGDVLLEGDRRVCTIGDDRLEEIIVTVDPRRRRLVYAITAGPFGFTQHSASLQVAPTANGCTIAWDHDFKPDERAPAVTEAVESAAEALTMTMT